MGSPWVRDHLRLGTHLRSNMGIISGSLSFALSVVRDANENREENMVA